MIRVLIVEDERVTALAIQQCLQQFGYEVVGKVATAPTACQYVEQHRPDVVLMDIRLNGDQDGIVAAQTIQRNWQIPVIFLTAHADPVILERAFASSPYGYIVKPFKPIDLRVALETCHRRHQQERQLFAQKQVSEATLNSLGDATIAIDVAGQITFLNPTAELFTGWPREQALGQQVEAILRLFDPMTGLPLDNPLRHALQGEVVRLQTPMLLRSRDGAERLIGDSAAPICSDDGQVIGGVMVFREAPRAIAAQLQARSQQLQQNAELDAMRSTIIDRVRDSLNEDQILMIAVEAIAHSLNAYLCNVALYDQATATVHYEYTTDPAQFQGRPLSLDNFAIGYEQLKQGQIFQFCCWSHPPSHPPLALLACPIVGEAATLGDIWVIRAAEQPFAAVEIAFMQQVSAYCAIALRQARLYHTNYARLQQQSQLHDLKEEFINTLSHELRTPITNIELATHMLAAQVNQLGLDDQKRQIVSHYLQILQAEGQRESKLIDNLLAIATLNTVSNPVMPSLILLQDWLPGVAAHFTAQAAENQLAFQWQLPPEAVTITTDPSYLTQIIEQLLDNACKFTPIGERIILGASPAPRGCQIQITNTGIMIPQEEHQRIFDTFYRVPSQNPWQYAGIGLGLSLVQKLVQLLESTIHLDSQDNYTRFILNLQNLPSGSSDVT